MSEAIHIEKPEGKLGVLIPGLGAVATTFIAGVYAIKKGISQTEFIHSISPNWRNYNKNQPIKQVIKR